MFEKKPPLQVFVQLPVVFLLFEQVVPVEFVVFAAKQVLEYYSLFCYLSDCFESEFLAAAGLLGYSVV